MSHSAFATALAERRTDPAWRRWVFVPYDQLTHAVGPLAELEPEEAGIVVVESPWKARRRPYHKQKLALVLTNLRHFALEQAERGVAVRHVVHDGPYREALADVARELGPLLVMRPAERELRVDLAPLVRDGLLEEVPHAGWLTARADFDAACGEAPWRMDAFYRHVRRSTGVLMVDGKPVGGKYSFDPDNRESWRGQPPAPDVPGFRADDVTAEVAELVEDVFARHPGAVDASTLPASHRDALKVWRWAREECLAHFGPYEDAMSTASWGLFHTRVSPLVNLHRLLPSTVVDDVLAMDLPLNSKEGFVRQVLGWREFVHHVHEATDGFRDLPDERFDGGGRRRGDERRGDGGWESWRGEAWHDEAPKVSDELSVLGAAPAFLGARGDVPPAFWGAESGLACLDHVVAGVWREGWSHHITRLMVLSNLATLLDVSPRALADWFWVAYVDAYDWVVEPNVIGMGTFGVGPLFTTKPYVSGAAYVDRMSDFCGDCAFQPRKDCPITSLYWAFLARHEDALADNQRLALPFKNLARRAPTQKAADTRSFQDVTERLARGERLEPR